MPLYTHDCDKCKSLGSYTYLAASGEVSVDLYFCASSILGGSLISREGHAGSAYMSSAVKLVEMHYVQDNHPSTLGLVEAYRRGKSQGLF